jgi:serine/threonine-protein kinase HipA
MVTTMERRAPARTLGLWMNGAYVGTWSLGTNGPDTLQYDPDWTRSEQGRPLSLSLPFMPGNLPHRGPHVRAWFENLLPDSKDILRRHWLELGARHGVVTADGGPAQAVLDDLVAKTPECAFRRT